MKRSFVLTLTLLLTVLSAGAQSSGAADRLQQGMNHYRQRDYQEALLDFRNIILDQEQQSLHGDAFLWTAKTYIALEDLDNAQRNLEFFLHRYPQHSEYPQGIYQKGRLLFQQGDYQNSVQVFSDFIADYPESSFYANALYWSGEALYHLGYLDSAAQLFREVVRNHRESFKYEAARYHLTLIDLKRREKELMTLLKWSHEESLKSLEDYQQRESTYEEALTLLRKKIAELTDRDLESRIDSLQEEIRRKEEESATYKSEISSLEEEIASLKTQLQTAAETPAPAAPSSDEDEGINSEEMRRKERLLDLKSRVLTLQMEIMTILYADGEENNG